MNKAKTEENEFFIRKNDYERYQLVLPYRFLFGRKRQRFIYCELEKRHPCFSDEFCFDTSFQHFSKKGVVADVMVIHKFTLAEYEAKRPEKALIGRFVGTGFFAECCKRQRFFMNEKTKKMSVMVIFLVGLIFFFCICGLFSLMRKTNTNDAVVTAVAEDETKELNEQVKEPQFLSYRNLFDEVSKSGGKISALNWRIEGLTEILEVRVKGVFPEQLDGFYMTSVNYENEQPVIQASAKWKFFADTMEYSDAENGEFVQKLRSVLLKNGAVLKEEKLNPYMVRFSCRKNLARTLLLEIDRMFFDAGRAVSSISMAVSVAAEGNVQGLRQSQEVLEISIGMFEGKAPTFGVDLKLIGENSDIFGDLRKITLPIQTVEKSVLQKNELPAKSNQFVASESRKIGEIRKSEGGVIIFYKTGDGKIKRVLEEN